MGRYIKDIELDQPIDVVSLVMEDYIYHNHFSRTDWNGEMVFYLQDSHGGERYLKWSYAGGVYHVEAWLKGPFGKEMDLDGVGGGASRKEFRESMDRLAAQLKSQQASAIAGGHVGSDPLHHSADYQAEHRAWREAQAGWRGQEVPGRQKAPYRQNAPYSQTPGTGWQGRSGSWNFSGNQGMGMGVLAIIMGIFFPVFGMVCGVVGMRRYQGTGRLLCIVAIVLSVLEMAFWVLVYVLYPVMLL